MVLIKKMNKIAETVIALPDITYTITITELIIFDGTLLYRVMSTSNDEYGIEGIVYFSTFRTLKEAYAALSEQTAELNAAEKISNSDRLSTLSGCSIDIDIDNDGCYVCTTVVGDYAYFGKPSKTLRDAINNLLKLIEG